jgi:hypothetical protein
VTPLAYLLFFEKESAGALLQVITLILASVKPAPFTNTSTPPENCPRLRMISVIAYEVSTILTTFKAWISLNHPLF